MVRKRRIAALAAIALGFAGVVMLLKPTLQPDQWFGALVGMAGGMIASIAYINVRELGRVGEPEARTVLWFSFVTSLFGLGWALLCPDRPASDGRPRPGDRPGRGRLRRLRPLAMTRAYRYGKTVVRPTCRTAR